MRVSTTTTITCPRCEAPVEGDFKYCPECAFRLRPGALAPGEEEQPTRRGTLLLVLAGAALLATGVWLGVEVLGKRKYTAPVWRPPRLEVADIQDHLTSVPEGIATWEPETVWWIPPPEEIPDRFMQTIGDSGRDDFRDALLQESLLDNPLPLASYSRVLSVAYAHAEDLVEEKVKHVPVYADSFQMMLNEATQGQWAEFLESVQRNPSQLSRVQFVRDLWRPPADDPDDLHYSRGHWEHWWRSIEQIHRARNEKLAKKDRTPVPPRPPWLNPDTKGLTDEQGVLILIPPEWVRVSPDGRSISWAIPQPEGSAKGEATQAELPVTGISWWDAKMFIVWARQELGIPNIDLPNGGEWLRAFHGGRAFRPPDDFDEKGLEGNSWPWGNFPDPVGCNNMNWGLGDELPRLRDVRREYSNHRCATVEGVLNMAGNAAEWSGQWSWPTGRAASCCSSAPRDCSSTQPLSLAS